MATSIATGDVVSLSDEVYSTATVLMKFSDVIGLLRAPFLICCKVSCLNGSTAFKRTSPMSRKKIIHVYNTATVRKQCDISCFSIWVINV